MQKKVVSLLKREHLSDLLRDCRVPKQTVLLEKGIYYLFHDGRSLHGIYTLEDENKTYWFLRRILKPSVAYFRPLGRPFTKASSMNRAWLSYLSEIKKTKSISLIVRLTQSALTKETLMISQWIVPDHPQLVLSFKKKVEAVEIKNLQMRLSSIWKQNGGMKVHFKALKEIGEKWSRLLIPKEMETILEKANAVKVIDQDEINIPFKILFHKEFLTFSKCFSFHQKPQVADAYKNHLPKTMTCVFHQQEEVPAMLDEFERVQRLLKKESPFVKNIKTQLNRATFKQLLENSTVLHFIGHGYKDKSENAHVYYDLVDGQWSDSDWISVSAMPRVLFLSACYGLSQTVIQHLFDVGLETLIYFEEEIETFSMSDFSSRFYWNWTARGLSAAQSIQVATKKSLNDNLNWAKLRLCGNGELKWKALKLRQPSPKSFGATTKETVHLPWIL